MSSEPTDDVRDAVEAVYRDESRCVFATLVRLLDDFDPAEELMSKHPGVCIGPFEIRPIDEGFTGRANAGLAHLRHRPTVTP